MSDEGDRPKPVNVEHYSPGMGTRSTVRLEDDRRIVTHTEVGANMVEAVRLQEDARRAMVVAQEETKRTVALAQENTKRLDLGQAFILRLVAIGLEVMLWSSTSHGVGVTLAFGTLVAATAGGVADELLKALKALFEKKPKP